MTRAEYAARACWGMSKPSTRPIWEGPYCNADRMTKPGERTRRKEESRKRNMNRAALLSVGKWERGPIHEEQAQSLGIAG